MDPIWRVDPLTTSEASALHDTGELVRLIRRGDDPNVAQQVRSDVLRREPVVLTPLEAAVAADRTDVLDVLLDNGASLDERNWTRLKCFADGVGADDAAAFLEQRRPADAVTDCNGVQTPW